MDDDLESPAVEVEPGDTIHVADDGGDVHDDDSVVINDNSFDSATDESVNVVVNVEVPESEPEGEIVPAWGQALIDQVAALSVAPEAVSDASDEVTDPIDDIVDGEAGETAEEVVDVADDAPAETKTEPVTKSKPKRRFGR